MVVLDNWFLSHIFLKLGRYTIVDLWEWISHSNITSNEMWEVYFEQNILTIVCLSWIFQRVRRYQRGNQNPSIEGQTTQWPKEGQTTQWPKEGQTTQWPKEGQTTQWPKEGQTTQWPKENRQKDKQQSTKYYKKTIIIIKSTDISLDRQASSASVIWLYIYTSIWASPIERAVILVIVTSEYRLKYDLVHICLASM